MERFKQRGVRMMGCYSRTEYRAQIRAEIISTLRRLELAFKPEFDEEQMIAEARKALRIWELDR